MTGISIREATASDPDLELLAPLFNAYRQFYGRPSDPALARAFLGERLQRRESIVYLATSENARRGAGFVQLYPSFSSLDSRRVWILNDLFVAPDARGSGVGRALMERARRLAIETGARRLILETMADNHIAQGLYRSLGYVQDTDPFLRYTLELA